MDPRMKARMRERTPRFNRDIVDGFAVKQMKGVEEYVDSIWRSAAERFPPSLVYHGFTRCTPEEEYAELTKRRNKQTFELTQSDTYMVKYLLSYKGKMLMPKHISLPYVGQAGTMKIYDSVYCISPVIADVAISVVKDTVFVPLPCAKLKFERTQYSFYCNDEVETDYVIWSGLHNQFGKKKARTGTAEGVVTVDMKSTLLHYFFCKFGFSDTFAKYTGTVPLLSDGPFDPEQINQDEWLICRSICADGMKPRGVKTQSKFYVPSNIHLAIRKEDDSDVMRKYIASFFYLVDHFPDRIIPEYVEETRLWRVLLGRVIWRGNANEGKLADEIDTHLRSLDDYIDLVAQRILQEDNIFVDNIYDFCQCIIETMADRIMKSDPATMYGKRLTVLRYALFDVVGSIFRFSWRFNNAARKEYTADEIEKMLSTEIHTDCILDLRRNHHGECNNILAPGDNYFFKITSNLVLQSDATRHLSGKSKSTVTDPAKVMHSSVIEIGSFRNLPKSEATGRTKANPYMRISDNGEILMDDDPERRKQLDGVQEKLRR